MALPLYPVRMSILHIPHRFCFDQTTLWLPHWFSLCLLLSVAACSDPDDGGKLVQSSAGTAADGVTQVESTLRLAFNQALPGLDPLRAGSHESSMLIGAVYDRLYRYALLERPYQLLPQAAESMPEISADGRSYIITLRPGQRFHSDPALPAAVQHAHPLQAADLVYSLLRHFDPELQSPWRWLWAGRIEGLDAWSREAVYDQPPDGLQIIDDNTLRITLTTQQSEFLHLLAHPSAAIVMREAVEHYADDFTLHAVGSGPYRLQDLSMSGISLRAVADYSGKPIALDAEGYAASRHADLGLNALENRTAPILHGIEIQIEHDADRRLELLRDGRIDALLLQPQQYPELLAMSGEEDAADATVAFPLELNADWLTEWQFSRQAAAEWLRIDFNMHSEKPDADNDTDQDADNAAVITPIDRDLRCALRDSIDWHAFNRRFYHGSGYVANNLIAPAVDATPMASEESAQTSGDGDSFSSIETLPELTFAHVDSNRNQAYFDWFQQQLSDAGYAAEQIQSKPFENLGALLQAYREQQWPLLFSAWSLDLPTAANILQLYAGNNAHAVSSGPGLANYRNPAFDQLLQQLSISSVNDGQLVNNMLELLADDCVTAAAFSPARIHVWRKSLLAWPDADFAAAEWLRFAGMAENQHNN